MTEAPILVYYRTVPNAKATERKHVNHNEFCELVNNDVRDKTTSFEKSWLREPANVVRVAKELHRLDATVTNQIEMSDRFVKGMTPGPARDKEQAKADSSRTARQFFRSKVRERLSEFEDLIGPDAAPVTAGQLRAALDAALDALDPEDYSRPRVDDAIRYLETLLDAVDPPAESEVA